MVPAYYRSRLGINCALLPRYGIPTALAPDTKTRHSGSIDVAQNGIPGDADGNGSDADVADFAESEYELPQSPKINLGGGDGWRRNGYLR